METREGRAAGAGRHKWAQDDGRAWLVSTVRGEVRKL